MTAKKFKRRGKFSYSPSVTSELNSEIMSHLASVIIPFLFNDINVQYSNYLLESVSGPDEPYDEEFFEDE